MKSFQISVLIILIFAGLNLQAQDDQDFKEQQDSILKEIRDVKPWYQFGNEHITIIPMAVTALDVTYYTQDENSYSQVGDQDQRYEPGQIRAVRFGILGTINFKSPWRYIFAGAYRAFDQGFNADSATDFSLYDLRLDIPTPVGTFSVGKMKEPSSMQREASMIYLGGFERAMNMDAMLPARNNGLMYTNNFWKQRVRLAAGVYKQVSLPNKIYWKDANNVFVGRLTVNPLYNLLEHHDLQLGYAARYSDFRAGGVLRQHPEAYFASKFVETDYVEGDRMLTQNVELAYRFKNLLFTSEYTTLKVDNPALESPKLNGMYAQVDYILTGERKRYFARNATFAPAIPRKSVQQGGPGMLELSARYSFLHTNASGLDGGDMDKIAFFVSWYPTILSKLQFGYNYVKLDRFGIIGYTHIYQFRFAILIG